MGARLRDVALLLLPLVSATSFTVADRGSAFSSLHVKVDAGEGIKAEPGSLVSYKGGLRLSIQADSSWFGRMFAGEAPYMTRLDADAEAGGECIMCPRELGSIETKALLSDEVLFLKAGSFLAADCDVEITSEAHATMARALLSGTGLRYLAVRGPGTCGFNGHGGLHHYSLEVGEKLYVDNGHVVAWSPSLQMELGWASHDGGKGAFFRSVASGEGLMCQFVGPGEVWVQTHMAPRPQRDAR